MPSIQVMTRLILAILMCLVFLCPAEAFANSRFVDNGDGTVTDSRTGLMWAQTDNMGHISWKNAKLYCENIILSRYSDWRMPTIEELETLFDSSREGYETICRQNVKSTPQIELSCGFVWSSDILDVPGGYSVSAYVFNFAKGYRYSSRMSQYRGYRALPVRSIEE